MQTSLPLSEGENFLKHTYPIELSKKQCLYCNLIIEKLLVSLNEQIANNLSTTLDSEMKNYDCPLCKGNNFTELISKKRFSSSLKDLMKEKSHSKKGIFKYNTGDLATNKIYKVICKDQGRSYLTDMVTSTNEKFVIAVIFAHTIMEVRNLKEGFNLVNSDKEKSKHRGNEIISHHEYHNDSHHDSRHDSHHDSYPPEQHKYQNSLAFAATSNNASIQIEGYTKALPPPPVEPKYLPQAVEIPINNNGGTNFAPQRGFVYENSHPYPENNFVSNGIRDSNNNNLNKDISPSVERLPPNKVPPNNRNHPRPGISDPRQGFNDPRQGISDTRQGISDPRQGNSEPRDNGFAPEEFSFPPQNKYIDKNANNINNNNYLDHPQNGSSYPQNQEQKYYNQLPPSGYENLQIDTWNRRGEPSSQIPPFAGNPPPPMQSPYMQLQANKMEDNFIPEKYAAIPEQRPIRANDYSIFNEKPEFGRPEESLSLPPKPREKKMGIFSDIDIIYPQNLIKLIPNLQSVTCYLNATIQMLLHVIDFDFIAKKGYNTGLPYILDLFYKAEDTSQQIDTVHKLISYINHNYPDEDVLVESDSTKYFILLIEDLIQKGHEQILNRIILNQDSTSSSCQKCGLRSVDRSPNVLYYLLCANESNSSREIIRQYFSSNYIQYCINCKKEENHVLKKGLSSLPQILVALFPNVHAMELKLIDEIIICNEVYQLKCFPVYRGDTTTGHYSFIKRQKEKWTCISDSTFISNYDFKYVMGGIDRPCALFYYHTNSLK